MRRQAIIEAQQLREAATKKAESEIIEKYAVKIREAVSSILEQVPGEERDDRPENAPLGEMPPGPPPASENAGDNMNLNLGKELGLGGNGRPQGLSSDEHPQVSPAAFDGEKACPCSDDGETIELDFAELQNQASREGGSRPGELEGHTDAAEDVIGLAERKEKIKEEQASGEVLAGLSSPPKGSVVEAPIENSIYNGTLYRLTWDQEKLAAGHDKPDKYDVVYAKKTAPDLMNAVKSMLIQGIEKAHFVSEPRPDQDRAVQLSAAKPTSGEDPHIFSYLLTLMKNDGSAFSSKELNELSVMIERPAQEEVNELSAIGAGAVEGMSASSSKEDVVWQEGCGAKEENKEDFLEGLLNDSVLSSIEEVLNVDYQPVATGRSGQHGLPSPEKATQEGNMLVATQDTEIQEKMDELEDNYEELQENFKKLQKNHNLLKEEKSDLLQAISSLSEKILESNTMNARLLYMNKVLDSSLNERQKRKLAESLSKTKTAEEAKTIYDTFSAVLTEGASANETVNSKEKDYLNESIDEILSRTNRGSISARPGNTSFDEPAEGTLMRDRMQRLAGIQRGLKRENNNNN